LSTPAGDRSRPACSSHGGAWQFFARRERRSKAVLFAGEIPQAGSEARVRVLDPSSPRSRAPSWSRRQLSVDPQTKAKTQATSLTKQATPHLRSKRHEHRASPSPIGPGRTQRSSQPPGHGDHDGIHCDAAPKGKWHAFSPTSTTSARACLRYKVLVKRNASHSNLAAAETGRAEYRKLQWYPNLQPSPR
jgi:hypothetical protein